MSRLLLLAGDNFTPLAMGSLPVWMDARDYSTLTFNGTTISAWRNKGSAGNAEQGTTANQPLYVASAINARPALHMRHDGANTSFMAIADSAALDYTRYTAFVVGTRLVDRGANETLLAKHSAAGNQREFYLSIQSSDKFGATASAAGTADAGVAVASNTAVGSPFIGSGWYDGTNHNTLQRIGGVTETASTALASIYNGTATMQIGARVTTADGFAGYIGEVLFFTRALNAQERNAILNYLQAKWGVA